MVDENCFTLYHYLLGVCSSEASIGEKKHRPTSLYKPDGGRHHDLMHDMLENGLDLHLL